MLVRGFTQPRLELVAKVILHSCPHSNVSEEQVFSMICKNTNPFLPSLGRDWTYTVKLAIDDCSDISEPGNEAKKAT